ncbi:helix-turn-helix transcriptional regulator [Halococcus sediminicola]|uniref:helix-turn-helix transcriptional regulator n=1 Tax=Halococcus sediminicola TaxID=1264579 RepID=UPI0006796396|nr:helix-turn-helix transcriptional regulator [Halococcus sediminicola]
MSGDRPRNDSGQYDDELLPETVLEVFDRRDDLARPLTSSDVMEALDCARRTALNKLNELVAAGSLESREVGARARVFWRPIPGDDHDARLKRLSAELGQPISVGETVYESGDNHPIEATSDNDSESDTEYNLSGPERVADPADEEASPDHIERDESQQ